MHTYIHTFVAPKPYLSLPERGLLRFFGDGDDGFGVAAAGPLCYLEHLFFFLPLKEEQHQTFDPL